MRAAEGDLPSLWGLPSRGWSRSASSRPERVEQTARHLIYLVHGALLIAVSGLSLDPDDVREQVRNAVIWALTAEATHTRSTAP